MTAAYRYGETRPQTAPFKSGVAVAIPDACFLDDSDSYKIKPAGSFTWGTAVATPSAPTVADTAVALDASGLANAATGVKISYQFPWGEGALSAAGSATPTLHAGLYVSGTPLIPPTPALWTNIYVEDSAGSGTYKLWGRTYGSPVIVYSYGAGQIPAAGNASAAAVTSAATDVTQYQFVQKFCGMAAQRYDGTNDTAYGIKDGNLRFDTAGAFQFDCASASFNVGDLIGMAKASGNTLEPQKVVAVAHAVLAIGRVVKPTSSLTTVLAEVMPQFRMGLSK